MQPTALSNTTAARIRLGVTLFALSILTAGVYGGCSKPATNNQNGGPSPKPTASPSPSGTPEVMLPDDTIIVIKDNSLDIDINTKLCNADSVYTYKCKDIEIGEMTVTPKGQTPITCGNIKADSKITVAEKMASKDIKVNGEPGNPKLVTIQFDPGAYPQCPSDGQHCGDNKHVKNAKSNTGGICKACTPDEHCEITIKRKMYAAPTSTAPVKK